MGQGIRDVSFAMCLAFDATRVGGRAIQGCVVAFPNNQAFAAPIVVLSMGVKRSQTCDQAALFFFRR